MANTDTPTTKTGRVSPAWGAMLEDIMGLWGYGEPDVDDVMETLAEHRPFIEAEARAGLDVERLRLVYHAEYEMSDFGCRHVNQHRSTWDCQERANEVAAEYAALTRQEAPRG